LDKIRSSSLRTVSSSWIEAMSSTDKANKGRTPIKLSHRFSRSAIYQPVVLGPMSSSNLLCLLPPAPRLIGNIAFRWSWRVLSSWAALVVLTPARAVLSSRRQRDISSSVFDEVMRDAAATLIAIRSPPGDLKHPNKYELAGYSDLSRYPWQCTRLYSSIGAFGLVGLDPRDSLSIPCRLSGTHHYIHVRDKTISDKITRRKQTYLMNFSFPRYRDWILSYK